MYKTTMNIKNQQLLNQRIIKNIQELENVIVQIELSQIALPFNFAMGGKILTELKTYRKLIIENDGFSNERDIRIIDKIITELEFVRKVFKDF